MRRPMPFALLPVLLLAGCGDTPTKDSRPTIVVSGSLTSGGKPWSLDEKKVALPPGVSAPPVAPGQSNGVGVRMEFVAVEGGESYPGDLDTKIGRFLVRGLKAGRYKIVLSSASFAPNAPDPFGNKFTRQNTKIVRDLKDGDDITIDVSKPEG